MIHVFFVSISRFVRLRNKIECSVLFKYFMIANPLPLVITVH